MQDLTPESAATYASADVGNLSGLNEALGREHADEVFRNIADIFAEHLHTLGGDVVKLRHGGDEFSAIVVGADKAAVEQALVAVRREVAEYIHSIGLESLPHSKDPLNPDKAGVGVYTATETIGDHSATSAKEIIDRADREIELSKGRQKAEASASHAEPEKGGVSYQSVSHGGAGGESHSHQHENDVFARHTEAVSNKLPTDWEAGIPNRKGIGTRWRDPNNPGNRVRLDKGNPNNSQRTQQVDHAMVHHNGKILGRDGKPIPGRIEDHPEDAHIPLSEYLKWKNWNSPL